MSVHGVTILHHTPLYLFRNCASYDLCEQCEAMDEMHDIRHVFLKLRRPLSGCVTKADGTVEPLLGEVMYLGESNLQS